MSQSLVALEVIVGYIVCVLVGLFGLRILWLMFNGQIDLRLLLSEKTGPADQPRASMSRLQLLIFTFVVSLSLFLVIVSRTKLAQTQANANRPAGPVLPDFPDVPGGILALLGISASSYAVGKAIQHTGDQSDGDGTTVAKTDAKKG